MGILSCVGLLPLRRVGKGQKLVMRGRGAGWLLCNSAERRERIGTLDTRCFNVWPLAFVGRIEARRGR